MVCKKCAEEVCDCSIMNAEELIFRNLSDEERTEWVNSIKWEGPLDTKLEDGHYYPHCDYCGESTSDVDMPIYSAINAGGYFCINCLQEWGLKVGETLYAEFNLDESTVQEPDWIPDGDGRAIGQQNFGINLSPLHAEGFNADNKPWTVNSQCIECENMVAVTDGSRYFVCDACVERMGAETFEPIDTRLEQNGDGWFSVSYTSTEEQANTEKKGFEEGDVGGYRYKVMENPDKQGWTVLATRFAESFNADTVGTSLHAEGNYSAWKTLGDVTMKDGVGFPKIIDFNRSKKEQEAFIRVAEKIVTSKDLNCTHCNPQGDRKVRHSVFILMATKPTSMKIKGDRTLKFKKGDIITLGKGCMNALYEDKSADTVGTPSPTFNENITGQDGPSDSPTNQTFEARDMHKAPSLQDVRYARTKLEREGYGNVIYDKYMVNQQINRKGKKQNRFYYTAITEKDGKYYPMGAMGGIENAKSPDKIRLFNIYGRTDSPRAHFGNMGLALKAVREKEQTKLHRSDSTKEYRIVTLAEMSGFSAEAQTLAEIEGPTAEATSGGLHSPSSFTMTWEDGTGQSSASIPPNEIAWAEGKTGMGILGWATTGVLAYLGYTLWKGNKVFNAVSSRSRKSCCGQKAKFNAVGEPDIGAANQDKQQCEANNCTWSWGSAHQPAFCDCGYQDKQECEANNCSWIWGVANQADYCNCDPTMSHPGGVQNQLDGGVTFQSEFSVGQINPIEVEGQSDVYGAEEHYKLSTPQLTQPHLGPRTNYRQNSRRNLKMW